MTTVTGSRTAAVPHPPMSEAGSIVLAGGGTAGHTSPLVATAHELLDQRPDLRLTAVGTARGLETTVIPAAGLALELIPPVPMPRRPGVDLALVGPAAGRRRSGRASRCSAGSDAQAVLGFGGYVSTPGLPGRPAARRCRSCCTSRTCCPGWPTGWPPG